MKKILTFDGGGIRGVFSLEILLRMQQMLREHTGNPSLVLSDHFDFFAGTEHGRNYCDLLELGHGTLKK